MIKTFYKNLQIYCVSFCALLFISATSNYEKISKVEARFEQVENKELIVSVEKYLSRFVGKDANDENRLAAESFINSLKFVAKTTCLYVAESTGLNLFCQVISKYTIKNIIFIDTPASILEEEIRRKLPIQEGMVVNLDDDLENTLKTTQSRVETFLKKNGYNGSSVEISKQVYDLNSPTINVVITIKNGAFTRVNSVKIIGDFPLRAKYIKSKYQRMCLSFNKIIESMSIGTISCYSRELENETTQSLLDKFADRGYVQARIRVSHYWVNPNDPSTSRACRNKNESDLTPRCVDLRVEIDKGPKVGWSINIRDQPMVNRNAFVRLISSIFVVDQLSRSSLPYDSDEVALDHMIIKNELTKKISFISARNVDEQEISRSAEQIKEYLAGKGYPNAEVNPVVTRSSTEINIKFDIYAGRPYFISSIRILPDKYMAYINRNELDDVISRRTFLRNGFIIDGNIDNAKEKITGMLKSHGFDEVTIKSDLAASVTGGVEVVFYITSEKRKIVDELSVINGFDEIDQAVLPFLANCDNYKNSDDTSKNKCLGSSFIASEVDADAKRLEEEYKNNNYLYAKVTGEVVKNNGYNIVFKVSDSRFDDETVKLTKQEIKEIIISGNLSTKTSVIRRLFPYENSVLSPVSLRKGLSNIRESRRFSPDISSSIIAGQEGSNDVYFAAHVVEKRYLSLDTSISFSTDQFFMLEAELENINLFSSMLRLNTTLGLGLFWGRKSILSNQLIWPFIFGKYFQLTINAPRIIYEDLSHRQDPSRRLQSKVSLELEWRIKRIRPYLKYSLIVNQEELNTRRTGIGEKFATLDGLIPTIKQPATLRGVLTPGIAFSNLDNPFDPHSGIDMNWWAEISVGEWMGKPPFVNFGMQNTYYIPLGPLTLCLQATFMRSFIDPSDDNWRQLKNNSLAADKLGGDRSLRGYDDASIGILTLGKNAPRGKLAGYFSNTAKIELRFPLTYGDSLGRLSGAFFVDQGMLLPCTSLFNCMSNKSFVEIVKEKGFGLSVGAGLRYSMPVPISLDYGISPLTGNKRLHVLLGYAF